MNEKSRYRVTGAILIVAVAVIVLPMLFDAKGLDPVRIAPVMNVALPSQALSEIPKDELVAAARLRQKIDQDGYSRVSGVLTGDPELVVATDGVPANGFGWGVQVGSFNAEANARALRDQLLADGYHAVLSHIRVDREVSTRVAVGPFIEEAEARKLQQELSARFHVQAILVRFGY